MCACVDKRGDIYIYLLPPYQHIKQVSNDTRATQHVLPPAAAAAAAAGDDYYTCVITGGLFLGLYAISLW